ncbi:MAG: twin transmembrane helix small protein [Halofilum sp. (in: g-proteobacteria)]|nr:twin transmembrane helix small protein [Halofilum sp. (in: g-proteobacteria)]
MNGFFVLAIVALLATIVIMVLGIRSMMHGGDEDLQASTGLMFRRVEFQLAAIALVLAAVLLAGGWIGGEEQQSDRLMVDLGVMPADVIAERYGPDSAEARAFGGISDTADSYLVTVAVRDRETSHRVDDARVTATVGQLGLSGTTKTLQAAEFSGALTFGNYFRLPKAAIYRIDLRVERPGVDGTDVVRLQYQRPKR